MNEIVLPDSDADLLKECRIDFFRSSGKGGQHVNKTSSAVRLTHLTTGIVVSCQEERSQYLNKKRCLEKLRQKVKQLNYKPPPRKKTRAPAWAKEQTLASKKIRSSRKALRRSPDMEDN